MELFRHLGNWLTDVDDAEDEVGVAGGPTISVGVQGFLILSQIKLNSRLAVKEIPEIWKKIILQNRSPNKASNLLLLFPIDPEYFGVSSLGLNQIVSTWAGGEPAL